MKKEIVYTDKYALILSDEEIKEGDYRVNIQRSTIHFVDEEPSYFNKRNDVFKKIIAHLPLSDAPIIEGVPLLPPLEQEDDAICPYPESKQNAVDWHNGYNKAKENYKYTEEDIRVAIFTSALSPTDDLLKRSDEIIEHLQKPSRPTQFECEEEIYYFAENGADLSRPKTTTNSQGQVELVGKYI